MTDPNIQIDELSSAELQALAETLPNQIESLRAYGKKAQTAEYWGVLALFSQVMAEIFRRRREMENDEIMK